MTAHTSTQAHAHTCLRGQIFQDKKKEKRLGIYGLVNTISDLKRVSVYNIRIYLNYCHKLSQSKKNNKILFPFLIRI